MAGFVTQDAREFVVGVDEVEQAEVHVDETAGERKRIDIVRVDDLDGVVDVRPRAIFGEVGFDPGDPRVENRIGYEGVFRVDLLRFLLTHPDLA